MTDKCCICGRIPRKPQELGDWSVPKLNKDDKGIRLACPGICSGKLYEKVRGYLRGKHAST